VLVGLTLMRFIVFFWLSGQEITTPAKCVVSRLTGDTRFRTVRHPQELQLYAVTRPGRPREIRLVRFLSYVRFDTIV
jgi:hypothetical protein